jgi:Fur family ferric uptake transcriptional regulator/Fur family peroxide stress response transcriptional regulator
MDAKRNTIQRQAIFDSVRELDTHPTAEQVYEHVVKKHPRISKATVYRNLGQLADAGDLLNIGSFCGSVRYDHNCRRHYHFICEQCKRVFDVNDYFPGLADNLAGMDGFEITGYILTFRGLCCACKEKH